MDLHEGYDVVADRKTYLSEFFIKNEIMEHCWIQMSSWKLNHLKYKKEFISKDSDISIKMENESNAHNVFL